MTEAQKTEQAKHAVVEMAKAMYEAIKAFGTAGVPSGHLYAAVMSVVGSLETYEQLVDVLVVSRLVRRTGNHCLVAL